MNKRGFIKEFYWYGQPYQVEIIPFEEITTDEKKDFNVTEGQFLVHLFEIQGFKTIVVFMNDDMVWDTTTSKILIDDKDLIEKIGFLIDDHYA